MMQGRTRKPAPKPSSPGREIPYAGLAIIGGGASGLMAAVAAARGGAKPVVLERMDRVGKKILATGNGRCNLTNLEAKPDRYHGADPVFVKAVLDRFGVSQTLAFFETLGLFWKTEDEGRVFPLVDQASAVLDVFRHELKRLGVEERCDSDVDFIEKTGDTFRLRLKNHRVLAAGRVIVAAGGNAAPYLGSNGSGYRLARMLGHPVVEPVPAIVQIKLHAPHAGLLKGVKVRAALSLWCGDECTGTESGEVQFTDDGLSGPPALKLSRGVHACLASNRSASAVLDLFPEKREAELYSIVERRMRLLEYKDVSDGMIGMIHKRLIPGLLRAAGIDKAKSCRELTETEHGRISAALKNWRLEVSGTRGWQDAQVSAGGVATSEIHTETLESRTVQGLFFAGEVLNVDGDSGGYNLQWAWSSGWVAGTSAAAGCSQKRF